MLPGLNYYDLLGISRDATPEEIRRAYHLAAHKLHPDKNKEPKSIEAFLQVQRAYDVLSDPTDRANYDMQLGEAPPKPIDIHVLLSRLILPIVNEPQLVYALINFSPSTKIDPDYQPPLNTSLVLDRSTSMQGERMDIVKSTAIELVRSLKPVDTLSIITFSDRADVLVSADRPTDLEHIEQRIRTLRSGGSTEIYQGLQAAMDQILRNRRQYQVNQVVLVTDGQTYGDESKCLKLADRASSLGIHFNGLGIGSEWNDAFLDELAARTGGNTLYIPQAKDIQRVLKEKFASFRQTFAENCVLQVQTAPEVTLASAYRIAPDAAVLPTTPSILLGSLPKTTPLSILLEFVLPPVEETDNRIEIASLSISAVLLGQTPSAHRDSIQISGLAGDAPLFELPPQPLFQALSTITLYRLQERAQKEAQDGEVEKAGLHLKRLAEHLGRLGEYGLAQSAKSEATNLLKANLISPEGSKNIKYGTRSLFLLAPPMDREP
jgi:Ca-activated chloride channel family protein